MKTTVKERLKEFINSLGIGQGAFERGVGLSNGYVNNIRVSIQPDKLQKIALKYPQLNTGWLMTGEGEMLKNWSAIQGFIDGLRGDKKSKLEDINYKEKYFMLLEENSNLKSDIISLQRKLADGKTIVGEGGATSDVIPGFIQETV
ncbi:transcriptional regulator [Bacteroidia bacterium]|nr:transcriptional regulator [Bacteroidia bacterium]